MARSGYWVLVAVGSIGLVVATVLAFTAPHPLGPVAPIAWVAGAVLPTYLLGAFALAMRPDQLAARWLAVLGSLIALQTAGTRMLPMLDDLGVGWLLTAATVQQFVTLGTSAALATVLIVFPDTDYRRRYQRHTVQAVWAVVAIVPLVLLLSERNVVFSMLASPAAEVTNPLFVTALAPLAPLAHTVFRWRAAIVLLGVGVMVLRYRSADDEARQTFRWPLLAAGLFALFALTFRFVEQVDQMPAGLRVLLLFGGWVPGLALLAASVLVALLRHRLIPVDLWLRRSILHGGVSALILLGQLGIAAALGMLAGRVSVSAAVATTLATLVVLQPLRRHLEERARGWVFGDSVQGGELLRHVGRTLEDAYDTQQLAANLAGSIVDGLRLEWARIRLRDDDGTPTAAIGIGPHEGAEPDLVVDLTHAHEAVGTVECGPKIDGEMSQADEELLAQVARQGALAIRNARLAAELEHRLGELARQAKELAASRGRIVQAQMAERRRIERNIHDGVQQEIVATIAKLRLSRNQLKRDPDEAAATLAELQEDVRRTLENLRELSRGIHPLVLSHRGLVAALDAQARHIPIDVCIDAAPKVRSARYAEDVEVAAYFVVSEGLTNVLKHAGTKEATVGLRAVDGHLIAEVVDRGRGCAGESATGSGIVGLRDRVESVGGSLEIESRPRAGTTLRARLPVDARSIAHV